ncbi:hypothetical protein AR1Y2_1716 [Anaerostipes rhamnosivorans]|jgi:hypothetical protein|uniref:Uncharacterized protein n=1 Tax=Anaerostipes rhamnosivorans TaxID=1229621 RepID=A0A4V1EG82_9FIRM|nr:hypothetical protein AR1Y2_1716 [Anaerostipes rhamnosivorans]
MPHSNHVENGRNVCWRRASVKKEPSYDSFSSLLGGGLSRAD